MDNLRVFNGALSEEEVNTLCYVNKVDKEYDPAAVDTPDTTGETEESTAQTPAAEDANTTESGSNTAVVVIVVVIIVVAAAVIVVLVSKKKKTKK